MAKHGIKKEYDNKLDNIIIKIIYNKKKIHLRDLYRRILSFRKSNNLDKKNWLSYETLEIHRKKLLEKNIISTTKYKRGKKRFYYLTENGKRFYGLDVIIKSTDKYLFQKIFEDLFLYELKKEALLFNNKKDFLNYLKKCNLSADQIKWQTIPIETSSNSEIVNLLYRQNIKQDDTYSAHWERVWKEQNSSFMFEDLDFFAAPIEIEKGYLIYFFKTEYWQINKNYKPDNYTTTYQIELPGTYYNFNRFHKKLSSFIHKLNKQNKNNNEIPSKDITKRIIDLLIQYELIKIIHIGSKQRIVISDIMLYEVIYELRTVLEREFSKLQFQYSLFKRPTKTEIKKLEYLMGKNESRYFLRRLSIIRRKGLDVINTRKETKKMLPLLLSNFGKSTQEKKIKWKKAFLSYYYRKYGNSIEDRFEGSQIHKYFKSYESIFTSFSNDYKISHIKMDNQLDYTKILPKFVPIKSENIMDENFHYLDNLLHHYIHIFVPEEILLMITKSKSNSKSKGKPKFKITDVIENIQKFKKEILQLENFCNVNHFKNYLNQVYRHLFIYELIKIKEKYKDQFNQYGFLIYSLFDKLIPLEDIYLIELDSKSTTKMHIQSKPLCLSQVSLDTMNHLPKMIKNEKDRLYPKSFKELKDIKKEIISEIRDGKGRE